jgi:hypothetical protein
MQRPHSRPRNMAQDSDGPCTTAPDLSELPEPPRAPGTLEALQDAAAATPTKRRKLGTRGFPRLKIFNLKIRPDLVAISMGAPYPWAGGS